METHQTTKRAIYAGAVASANGYRVAIDMGDGWMPTDRLYEDWNEAAKDAKQLARKNGYQYISMR